MASLWHVVAVALMGDVLVLDELLDLRAAVEHVWRAPDVIAAAAVTGVAEAEAEKAELLPNPELEASLSAIPLDPALMPLGSPTGVWPNISVMLGTTVELGKREHRQTATRAQASAAALELRAVLQATLLDLYDAAAEVAAAQLRTDILDGLLVDAHSALSLQQRRVTAGDAAAIDAARASLEAQRLRSQRDDEAARLAQAQVACGRTVGVLCGRFSSTTTARTLLEATRMRADALDERPDLRALEQRAKAADAEERLANAHVIPDPTIKVGYLYDPFLLSESMLHNGLVSVSIPLPAFDHGQADARRARAQREGASRLRERLRSQAQQSLDVLDDEERLLRTRMDRLEQETLPLAREVVAQLEAVVDKGGGAAVDLLLARRALADALVEQGDLSLSLFHVRSRRLRTTGITGVTQ